MPHAVDDTTARRVDLFACAGVSHYRYSGSAFSRRGRRAARDRDQLRRVAGFQRGVVEGLGTCGGTPAGLPPWAGTC